MRVRVPTTIQMEAAGCGAASLKMLLDHYDCKYSLEEVSRAIDIGRDGSTIGDIRRAAERFGLKLVADQTDIAGLLKLSPPFILWWDSTHFLIYEGSRGKKFCLNDPAIGPRVLSAEEFSHYWTGVYITPEEGSRPHKHTSQNIVLSRDISSGLLGPSKYAVLLATLLSSLTVIPSLLTASLTAYYTDEVLLNQQDRNSIIFLWTFALLAGISALSTLASYRLLNESNFKNAMYQCRCFLEKMLSLPLKWIESKNSRELAVRLILPLTSVNIVNYTAVSSCASVVKALVIVFFLFSISYTLGSATLLVFCTCAAAAFYLDRTSYAANITSSVKNGQQQSHGLLALSEIERIRCSGNENSTFSTWAGYYTSYINAQQVVQNFQSIMFLVSQSSYYILFSTLLSIGPILIMHGHMSIGSFIAVQLLMGFISSGISAIPTLLTQYQAYTSPIGRYKDVLEASLIYSQDKSDAQKPGIYQQSNSTDLSLCLSFSSFSFYYTHTQPLFSCDDLKINLAPGVTVVKGGPGSGKSTFLKLLSGLYTPVNGHFVRTLADTEDQLGMLPYIPSSPTIYDASFFDNITTFNRTIERENVTALTKHSGLFNYIKKKGLSIFDTMPSHGLGLSQDERIALIVARVMSKTHIAIVVDSVFSTVSAKRYVEIINLLKESFNFVIIAETENSHDFAFDNVIDLHDIAS